MKQQILNLGKDSLIYGIGSVVTRFIGLITLPLFTAYLTPEEYGVLAMLALLTMVAQPVFSLGLAAAMGPSYFSSDSPLNKSKAVWTVFAINTVSAMVLVAVAWLFPEMLGQLVRLPAEYSSLIGLSLTGCALTILVTSFTQRVQFERQAKLYVAATLATALAAILISIVTVVFLGWGVEGMVIGQFAGNATTFFAFFLIGFKKTKPSISLIMTKELLRQGCPLIPSFAFLFILMHSNKYILEVLVGIDAVGVYSVGFNMGMAISVITGGVVSAWYPFFMSYINRQTEAGPVFSRIFTYYVFGAGFICILFFLIAKPVIIILTDNNFHDAYIVVGLVAAANYFQTIFNLFLPGLYYNKEIKYVSVIQFLSVLLSVPVTYFCILSFGILGAGIGLVIGNLLMAGILHLWNIVNKSRYPVVLYEWKRILQFILYAVLIVIANSIVSYTTLASEILKSMLFGSLALIGIILLLNRDERYFFGLKGKR